MGATFNRRKFLHTGAIAGAFGLISPRVKGQTIETFSSEIGKSKWDLDSPALCVDLDKMARNIKAVNTR